MKLYAITGRKVRKSRFFCDSIRRGSDNDNMFSFEIGYRGKTIGQVIKSPRKGFVVVFQGNLKRQYLCDFNLTGTSFHRCVMMMSFGLGWSVGKCMMGCLFKSNDRLFYEFYFYRTRRFSGQNNICGLGSNETVLRIQFRGSILFEVQHI